MAFARLLRNLVRDPAVGPLVAPIVSDEARTFGLEPLIAEAKIYAPEGQRYMPVDADLPLHYAESTSGQVLQEGITEAGALASFIAAGDGVRHLGPAHAAGLPLLFDVRLPAGRRPGLGPRRHAGPRHPGRLHGRAHDAQGEGLQHDDGHSPLLASTNPAARVYDPAFAYEIARDHGGRPSTDMLGPDPEDRFWYLTLYNENYPMPALPEGPAGDAVKAGIVARPLPVRRAAPMRRRRAGRRATPVLLGADVAGGRWRRGDILAERLGRVGRRLVGDLVDASCASDALAVERWNRLHPDEPTAPPYVTDALGTRRGPGGGRHRLHAGRARPGGPLGATGPSCRSAPTGSAAPTPATPCGRTSRSTAPTWWWRCCQQLALRRPDHALGRGRGDRRPRHRRRR